MILRKPYAFLIKQFRIIHIIITFLSVYILSQTSDIYTFFSGYIKNGYSAYIYDGMSSDLVAGSLFLILILLIVLLSIVGGLLVYKKKKSKIYAISLLYYVLLIVFFIFYKGVFNTLESGVISADAARVYNDVSLLFYLPQYALVIFFGVRSLGFNVKQFNFKDDLKKMDLDSVDNEEVELNIEFNAYKTKRGFRRFIREMRYYIKENLIFFIVIIASLTFVFSYNIINNLAIFTNYYYDSNESFYSSGVYLNFESSIITNTDIGGDIIRDGKEFFVVTLNIENSTNADVNIDLNNYKLVYNESVISPSNEYANYFSDYGSTLNGTTIKYNTSSTYVLVYVLDEQDVNSSFDVRIFTTTYEAGGVIYPVYTFVELEPVILKEVVINTLYEVGSSMSFSNTNIDGSSLVIDFYEVNDLFYYEYEKCLSSVCNTYLNSLYIDYGNSAHNGKTILALESTLVINESLIYYTNNKSYRKFFDNFVKVEYTVDDETFISGVSSFSTVINDGKYYLLVDEDVENASSVNLLITIRNKVYTYKLK